MHATTIAVDLAKSVFQVSMANQANRDPELLPIPTKQPEQQALQSLHRCRQQLIETRTARINFARGVLAEFGISLPRGVSGIGNKLSARVDELPIVVVPVLNDIIGEISDLKARVIKIDRQLEVIAKQSNIAMHLLSIPASV